MEMLEGLEAIVIQITYDDMSMNIIYILKAHGKRAVMKRRVLRYLSTQKVPKEVFTVKSRQP